MGNAEGTFGFTLAFFEDEAMTTSIAAGAEIPVGSDVYGRIHFNGPSLLKMILESCVAYPTEDPAQAGGVEWPLVKNGYGYIGIMN